MKVVRVKGHNRSYLKREKVYKQNDIPIVFCPSMKKKWQNRLRIKILEIEADRHNRVMTLVKKLLLD